MNLVLDLDPCPDPCGPSAKYLMLVQHPRIDTGSSGPCWGKEEKTASVYTPLMTGTMMSHNCRIPTYEGNPVSSVQAGGIGNIVSAMAG